MPDSPPTFSESWYRIANQRICLRPSVKVRRQNFRGERWIILENPLSNQFFRLRPAAYEFVARLRPEKTVEEVWKECLERFPDEAPGQEAVIQLLSQLYLSSLLQYDLAADSAKLFERYEKTRQREKRAKLLNVMFMRFPLLDPDQFLVKTLPIAKLLISPFGAVIWLAVVSLALKLVAENWTQLRDQSQSVLSPGNLPLLYAGMVLVKAIHEFGHAYFCRRYGGEVHVMGVMLMIFTPMPYVDATSSWGFRKRWQRVLVGAAGMIVELFVAAIATFVWAKTGQGTLHSLAYNMMFVASVSTVVFNINPLLRFDGYYMLSDLLEIPNLHQRSLQHLKHLGERYLFGLKKSRSPALKRKEAAWLTSFGITSGIYRVIVFGGILLFVADRLLIVGIIMAAVCAIAWVMRPAILFVRYLAASPQLDRQRWRAIAVSAAIVAGLLVLFDLIPFPHHFRAPGVVESRQWTEVLNKVPGQLEAALAPAGATVKAGQPLLRLKNQALEYEIIAARASIEEMEARLREAMQNQTPNLKPLNSRLESLTKRLERLLADKESLVISARQDGLWVAPHVKDMVGRFLPRGTSCGLIVDPAGFEFVATVPQEDVDRLFTREMPGAEVRLKGQADVLLKTGPLHVIPAEQRNLPSPALGWAAGGEVPISQNDPQGTRAAEPFFQVRTSINSAAEAAVLHGRAGRIRFDLEAEPLLPRGIRRLRQLLQKRYQL